LLQLPLDLCDELLAPAAMSSCASKSTRLQLWPVILLHPGDFKLGLSLMVVNQSHH
jgi:hypothetical protein